MRSGGPYDFVFAIVEIFIDKITSISAMCTLNRKRIDNVMIV